MRAAHPILSWTSGLYLARGQLIGGNSIAERLRDLLKNSAIRESHRVDDPRVQDPYSLRAAPTVLGAVYDFLGEFEFRIGYELDAVTDNPLVFAKGAQVPLDWQATVLEEHMAISPEDAIISGANFHAPPLALPLDYLAIALCHLAGIAERRIYLMTGAFEPESHLKPFLAPPPGLQSGLMIAQYTAAACVNEMVGLATPASVANIPPARDGGLQLLRPAIRGQGRRAMELAEHVVAIELLCAAQGLEAHRPLKSGKGVEAAHAKIRRVVKPLTEDRPADGGHRSHRVADPRRGVCVAPSQVAHAGFVPPRPLPLGGELRPAEAACRLVESRVGCTGRRSSRGMLRCQLSAAGWRHGYWAGRRPAGRSPEPRRGSPHGGFPRWSDCGCWRAIQACR